AAAPLLQRPGPLEKRNDVPKERGEPRIEIRVPHAPPPRVERQSAPHVEEAHRFVSGVQPCLGRGGSPPSTPIASSAHHARSKAPCLANRSASSPYSS